MRPNLYQELQAKKVPIGIVGLGYVGLPLACLFAEKFRVVGFDIKESRVAELAKGHDRTREVEDSSKLLNPNIKYSADPKCLAECPVIIVAVPTPVDEFTQPDLTPVIKASETVGKYMSKGAIVVFESTVYPGVTEKICTKYMTQASGGLVYNKDYFLGYSPERVNPGDKLHTIDKIKKVVSGSTPEVADLLCDLYGSVVTAGIHRAPNMATAEAAKVIENTQRDVNIALINELALLFDKIGLDTQDVLAAARTKWNFLDFRPGLVGGHCIGVDPYYLTHLAASVNFHTQAINAGRRINDSMGQFIAEKTLQLIVGSKAPLSNPLRVGILGVTFKEDCPDVRNTRVVDIANTLEKLGVEVHMIDPVADVIDFEEEYKRHLTTWDKLPTCDAIIVAVKHKMFASEFRAVRLNEKLGPAKVLVDVKACLDREECLKAGMHLWRL
jgi:UDP-N-acetyl-D-galactosamine dehydrogenase